MEHTFTLVNLPFLLITSNAGHGHSHSPSHSHVIIKSISISSFENQTTLHWINGEDFRVDQFEIFFVGNFEHYYNDLLKTVPK